MYGSKLHPSNKGETSMTNYIIGVADPRQWHSEDHYASWLIHLGGARMITDIANDIGAGVHFNPFVSCNNTMIKYGVVRMHDLIQDIWGWERFYLSGRLQKPVNILVYNLDIKNVNTEPESCNFCCSSPFSIKFTDEDLYAKICSLSYMGDLRMLFTEEKNKVNKIVQGQFHLFEEMYEPFLEECEAKNLLRFSSAGDKQVNIFRDCGLSAASTLISALPSSIRSEMAMKLGDKGILDDSGLVRHKVMFSSTRQAVAGLLTSGAVHGVRYVANKMRKAWNFLGVMC
ncbi:unnamed protein product [Withania somnifera]